MDLLHGYTAYAHHFAREICVKMLYKTSRKMWQYIDLSIFDLNLQKSRGALCMVHAIR